MIGRFARILACCALALASAAAASPARRIVSLSPHATELLFAAGAGEFVVGALDYSNYPEAAKAIPRVGDNRGLDLERIASLHPDLVVAWPYGYGSGQLEALRALGYRLEISDPHSFAEIAADIERLGRLAGTEATATKSAAAMRERVAALRSRYAARAPLAVFYEIWSQPLYTLNGQHLVSRAIELCGGRNVFAKLPVVAPTVSVEAVLAANPEVIVTATDDGMRPGWLDDWKRWPALAAVRANGFIVLDAEQMNRASPRMLDAVTRMCEDMDKVRGRLAQAGRKKTP
jgi:iron complex transport system substrate-binding protein